ncbi:DUF2786 domain-containing protein [Geodermatophilus marinus]|uniref:DUF2786 domain-containing protein n=1 Tax=Geodermatophilus sp. LHW52908 TaxID=2303986 RepID=UPI000E3CE546|nr:DUF2786 domain-containing protein [Geodermatophilus sp. LHW52908]RFU18956.1 DUF2786 domain-containing protein [Geodermatophilus sp. LHW52908]
MADDARVRALLLARMLPDDEGLPGAAEELAALDPAVDRAGAATGVLLTVLEEAFERGWQPADVVHAVGREASARSAPLAVALIAEHARASGAERRAPEGWVEQLRELGALSPGEPAVVAAWHRAHRRPAREAWRVVLLLAASLRWLARIDLLMPPPSRWGPPGSRPAPGAGSAPDDSRVLRRIRGLLAKAESTEFPDEAEALTAKAQELMTRHAVDAALLGAGPSPSPEADVGTRRVHVAEPYVRARMHLLAAVAEANDVRLVWYERLGIANLVGARPDLDAVELLFTSLLLQVAQGLSAAERGAARGPASRSFRRSFLLGYAARIGERLQAARRRATAEAAAEHGVDLLPVLRGRQEAVEARAAELFPRVRSRRSRASVDAGGWFAGRAAAECADVGTRRSSLR